MPGRKQERIDTKALFAEIRADEHAARVRDYGAEDAATYEERQRIGASMLPKQPPRATMTAAELEQVLSEVERSWGSEQPRVAENGRTQEVQQGRSLDEDDGREM